MAGTLCARQLTARPPSRASFAVADRRDDEDIRRLLRDHPMPGAIAVSLEREPDFFADHDWPGTTTQTIVAREHGRVVCIGQCAIRDRYVNGVPCRVGYLGGLRLAASHAGRFDILRRGYAFFRELQRADPAGFYFTSIAADNGRARRFLERNLPGMPRYEFLSDLVTLILPAHRSRLRRRGGRPALGQALGPGADFGALAAFIDAQNQSRQLAPCWSTGDWPTLNRLALAPDCFRVVRNEPGGRIRAAGALWDQRGYKQCVLRGYAPWLRAARPALNALSRVLGTPRLPGVGETLAGAFVSHLAVSHEDPDAMIGLVEDLRDTAVRRGIRHLILGLDARDPRLAVLRRPFPRREYRTRLYLAHWPEAGGALEDFGHRFTAPEAALL